MINNPKSNRLKKDFKADLVSLDEVKILRKHIIFGQNFLFKEDKQRDLREEIADKWNVHPVNILIVGSSKLGFSIAEKNKIDSAGNILETKPRYRNFSDNSDIDVAIISPTLFDTVWKTIYDFSLRTPHWTGVHDFRKYFFKGWIRPDMLPFMSENCYRKNWFEYFKDLTNSGEYGPYKIRAGIYKDWNFLEDYQLKAIKECKNELGDSDADSGN
jgi:hypothetical protein